MLDGRPGGVRFDVPSKEDDVRTGELRDGGNGSTLPASRLSLQRSPVTTAGHPFGGLLQGDVCGASSSMTTPQAVPTQQLPRGEHGPRGFRTRSGSRERNGGNVGASASQPRGGTAPRASQAAPATGANSLETLVAGITQIQQVLLRGKASGETSEFDPSKAVSEFPKLAENTSESGAIDFQDWLYLVEQQVGSLAAGASTWWTGMLEAAMQAYSAYQAATPIQRLTVKAELPFEWEDEKYSKLEKRVAALMLGALPQQMKEEMVSYRVRRVHQQLFRLLINYQPGGSTDRALVLAQLEAKQVSADPGEVVAALRKWFRWLQRARDLQLSLPDPSVQIRSLTILVKRFAEKNPDLQFKISLAKTELRVQSRPSQETALKFFQHLLAEIEQMGPSRSTSRGNNTASAAATSTTPAGDPRTKSAQATPTRETPTSPKEGKGDGKGNPCKWFLSEQGCGRGRSCKFLHDWTQVVKAERCLVRGSKLHKVRDCPRKDLEPTNNSLAPRGLNKKELKTLSSTSTPSTSTTSASTTTVSPPPPPSQPVAAMTPAAKAAADPPLSVSNESLREVLAETTKVLKALAPTSDTASSLDRGQAAVQDPLQLLSRRLQRIQLAKVEEKVALLDSGASHAYRNARDAEEKQRARPVNVRLAEGETTLLQTEAGTLIGEGQCDTLVPLGQLVEILGCKVRWTKGNLVVTHPVHGKLRVRVRDYCPELAEHEALKLIAELEEKRLSELNSLVNTLELKVVQSERVMEWFEHCQKYVASGDRTDLLAAMSKAPFLQGLPLGTIATAAEEIPTRDADGWRLLKSMPWSRRKRRSLFQEKDWNVHLFSGPSGKADPTTTAAKMAMIEVSGAKVDVDLRNSNLLDLNKSNGIYKVLLWAAAQGRLRTLIGGPPRRSYVVEDTYRRPKEEALIVKMLVLAMVAMEGRRQARSERVGFALEHPNRDVPGGALWSSPMWKSFSECFSMTVINLSQGSTGSNMDLEGLEGLTRTTNASGVWTDEFVKCVGAAVNAWNGFSLGESILCSLEVDRALSASLGKMTAKEWQLHVRRDHIPYRKDCRHCVQASAGKPHRRVSHRSAYVLSADVAGPFRSKGVDTETNQHRFMLVCAYQFPKLPETSAKEHESVEEDTGAGIGDLFLEEDEEIAEGEDEARAADNPDEEGPGNGDEEELTAEEREAKEATEPLKFSVAYFVRPLRGRKSSDVLRALQEVYIDVKMLGLPVCRLHADRAREFRTAAVMEWAAARDVQITRTEGDSPAQNGVAEQAVKYIKSRTRILLSSAQERSGREAKEVKTWWPMAAETAALRQRSLVFGQDLNPPAGFGSQVYVKRKKYGAEARDLDPKWGNAVYLGPARDVPGGHVVLTEDDHLWNTCNVRQLPDVPMEPDPSTLATRRRVVGKRPPPAVIPIGHAKSVRTDPATSISLNKVLCETEKVRDKRSVARVEFLPAGDHMKSLAQVSWEREWFSLDDCLHLLEDTPFRKPNQTRVANAWGDPGPDVYVAFGAYQHGGFVGLTKATEHFEYLTKYLVGFLKHHAGAGDPFTSVVVARNLGTKLHKDKYNIHGRRNITISFGSFSGGGVWIEGEHGDHPRQEQQLPNGDVACGTVLPSKDAILKFDPRRWHSSMPWTGKKWTVIGYCNRGINRMEPRDVQRLESYGFPLPDVPTVTLSSIRTMDDVIEYDYCETEDEEEYYDIETVGEEKLMRLRMLLDEEERIESFWPRSENSEEKEAVNLVNVRAMKLCEHLEAKDLGHQDGADPTDAVEWFRLCRLVEGGEQHGVEDLLRHLEEPLQVVYTMTLGEVRENIEAWRKAILKEAQALLDCGALVKMHPSEEKRLTQEGRLVVLPSKGVFTVKPPDQAIADGVLTKPQDQTESFDGVLTKPQDQTESFDGVLTKPQDQTESFGGVLTKPQDQTESFDGVLTKPQDQTESFEGAATGRGSQKGKRKIKVMLVDSLFKRKARLVICGNFEKHITEELYAGGCQTESLRVMISHAASRRTWDAAVTDIRNAFLLAPMSTDAVYGLRFPKVFILALGQEWEGLYRVDRALYGFRRSPRLWGTYRDGRLRTAKIKVGSRIAILKRLTADENIWQVLI